MEYIYLFINKLSLFLFLQKRKLSNTALPSSFKVLPAYSVVDAKEEIAPLVKNMTSGNANARNTSSYCSPEDSRMINLEKKVEFLLVENLRLNQEVSQLKNGRFDDKRKIECIEQTLSQSLYRQNSSAENLCRAVGALEYEHTTLKDRVNRFLENPFSREEHVMLIRHMEAVQGQIVHIDQHVMSHANMINDLSTSLRSLANIVANDRVPGVDIQPLG